MSTVSRRRFLQGLAATPIVLGAVRPAWAASFVRYDIDTPQGQDMLAVYANAIRTMQGLPDTDPRSWRWQWYTHFIGGAKKPDEIARIFGDAVTPERQLAEEMWNTCQSHAGQDPNNFLPWHRLFVYYHEQIVRQLSGRADFALPYWNYTSPDPTKRGVVPLAFRLPDDPVFSTLYRPNRTTLANSGEPIHKDQPGDAMDISVPMAKANYSTIGSEQGFCRAIDSGIHGRIHVLTGTSTNMGSVPWAGRDPLFWVHHANIDRLWTSWNRNGGKNPYYEEWTYASFVFADGNGQRVSRRLYGAFSTTNMGYTYDAFEPKPASTLSASSVTAQGKDMADELVARARAAAQLGRTATQVALLPVTDRATPVLGLDPAQPGKRTYLVLKGLHTWKQPDVLYHVYLLPHAGARPEAGSYVGNINFFDAEFHDHGNGALDTALGENFYSFDVTAVLQGLARKGLTPQSLLVSFVPGGRPSAGAEPLVGSIELRRQ